MLKDTLIIDGDIQLLRVIDGDVQQLRVIDGDGSIHISPGGHTDIYDGDYIATPKITESIFPTQSKLMTDNFTVLAIPRWEVSNEYGKTFIIGEE